MSTQSQGYDITTLLLEWRRGNDAALAALIPLIYDRLKEIAGHLIRDRRGLDALQTTALVHETYLRIADLNRVDWQDRAHFFATCARLMRRVLIDHARHHGRAKRGGGALKISPDELSGTAQEEPPDLLELDEALSDLAKRDSQMSHIVELSFFGGLNRDEIAEVLGISSATVTRRWRSARAWLLDYLSKAA